jgi:hypothetical protein
MSEEYPSLFEERVSVLRLWEKRINWSVPFGSDVKTDEDGGPERADRLALRERSTSGACVFITHEGIAG